MKIVQYVFLFLTSTVCLAHYKAVITRKEYEGWVIYQKNNDKLFVAKLFRYNADPYYYGHTRRGKIFYEEDAQRKWEALDKLYNENLPENKDLNGQIENTY